jgi:hypothetical protein
VNRTFRDKLGGLVVDYIGIAESLRAALADYTERDRARQEVGAPVEEALALLEEKHEILCELLYGCPWREALDSESDRARIEGDHGRSRPSSRCGRARPIVSDAVAADGVIDIYVAAGIEKPDISIIDDDFARRLTAKPHPNLQIELLKRLFTAELKTVAKRNLIAERTTTTPLTAPWRRSTSKAAAYTPRAWRSSPPTYCAARSGKTGCCRRARHHRPPAAAASHLTHLPLSVLACG